MQAICPFALPVTSQLPSGRKETGPSQALPVYAHCPAGDNICLGPREYVMALQSHLGCCISQIVLLCFCQISYLSNWALLCRQLFCEIIALDFFFFKQNLGDRAFLTV